MRRRIGRRDELGSDLASRAEGGMVERRQVLANRATGIGTIGSPLIPRNGALLVGVSSDQAGINGEAFSAHQTLAQASFHHGLEQVPEDIALPEAAMPVAREGRVVRHLALETQSAEPSIRKVEMHLLAQPPLGTDAHAVAHDKHRHHQLWIDRRPSDGAVEGLQFRANTLKIEEPVDATQKAIGGDVIVEPELIEQLRRFDLHPHHRRVSPQPHCRTESRLRRPINRRLNQHNPPKADVRTISFV